MVTPALTALALIWTVGQHATPIVQSTFQAVSPDETVTEPPVQRSDIITSEQVEETIIEAVNGPIDLIEAPIIVEPSPTNQETEVISQTIEASPVPTELEQSEESIEDSFDARLDTTLRHTVGTANYDALLKRAQASLSGAKTASGRFLQANSDGSIYSGAFALSRPGKLRFDYDDPVPVLIVSDGTTVAMEDRDLETIDRVPLGTTPLGLILDDELVVTDDIIINGIIERDITFEIIVEDATGEMLGTLTMVFSKTTNELIGWRTVDAERSVTRVSLIDVETNQRINPRQFILRDADDEEDER
ncbi:MAG: outer-membrane lipoprotein carrier protein LolA [Pseudomonadota bacterium]